MAYVLFDLNYIPQLIAKDMNELNLRNSRWKVWQNKKAGHMLEISNSDFATLQAALKNIKYDGTTVSYVDPIIIGHPQNEEQLQKNIDYEIEQIDRGLSFYKDTDYGTELVNYKNNLLSIDTSSITYPMTMCIRQYLLSQNKSILGSLQLP
jgi:hypothetical protein